MSESARVVDLAFGIAGGGVPDDYADMLWRAVRAVLPWLEADAAAGVHPLARVSSGPGPHYLSKYSRLTLRLAADKVDQARALCGAELDLSGPVKVGAAKVRMLAPAKVVYSPFVALGLADEAMFVAECSRQLAALGINGRLIVGRPQTMLAEDQPVLGFSLMLHGLAADDSLRLQSAGIGLQHKRGCGIFVQHKSIAAVGGD